MAVNDDELKVINPNKSKDLKVINSDKSELTYMNVVNNSIGRKKRKKKFIKELIPSILIGTAVATFFGVAGQAKISLTGKEQIIKETHATGAFDDIHIYEKGDGQVGYYSTNNRVNDDGELIYFQTEISQERAIDMIVYDLDKSNLSTASKYIAIEDFAGVQCAKKAYGDVTFSQKRAAKHQAYLSSLYNIEEVNDEDIVYYYNEEDSVSKGARR